MNTTIETTDGVTVMTIMRADVHNCVDASTAAELMSGVLEFEDDESQRVLIVTGDGVRAFSSGADLTKAAELLQRPEARESGPMGFTRLRVSKPTIAAIEGYCLAGGLEMACWCDFRVAGASATFGVVNRRWGVPLIDGGTQRLPRIVGLSNALYLIDSGVVIDASTALRMGLLQEIVADGSALARAVELASVIVAYPQDSLKADRASALASDGMEAERVRGEATLRSPDMAAGVNRFVSGDRPTPPTAPHP